MVREAEEDSHSHDLPTNGAAESLAIHFPSACSSQQNVTVRVDYAGIESERGVSLVACA